MFFFIFAKMVANSPDGLLNEFRGAALPRRPLMVRAQRCCAHSARRFRDGADAARSPAATELRRSRCCDGAAQISSVALILRVASRRDALNEEPASFSLALI